MSALTDEGPAEPIGIERRIERDWALGFRFGIPNFALDER